MNALRRGPRPSRSARALSRIADCNHHWPLPARPRARRFPALRLPRTSRYGPPAGGLRRNEVCQAQVRLVSALGFCWRRKHSRSRTDSRDFRRCTSITSSPRDAAGNRPTAARACSQFLSDDPLQHRPGHRQTGCARSRLFPGHQGYRDSVPTAPRTGRTGSSRCTAAIPQSDVCQTHCRPGRAGETG